MKYVFYITNHGFGHASRNVPIILELLKRHSNAEIYIKSDMERCAFLRRNLAAVDGRIYYYTDCSEVGLILKKGSMVPDIDVMKETIEEDQKYWPDYISREIGFLRSVKPSVVISDVICWGIKAAKECGLPTLLLGNFTWESMYRSLLPETYYRQYSEYYALADRALWYEIHVPELEQTCDSWKKISLVSRDDSPEEIKKIRDNHERPLVFVSLGASAELNADINVSSIPYDFVYTRGITLTGDNAIRLPDDMINTPDYIAAADYIISKGGWSTVAEILLRRKKSALLMRDENSEDNITRDLLTSRRQCISLNGDDLHDIGGLLAKIDRLNPDSYDIYYDSRYEICEEIEQLAL